MESKQDDLGTAWSFPEEIETIGYLENDKWIKKKSAKVRMEQLQSTH